MQEVVTGWTSTTFGASPIQVIVGNDLFTSLFGAFTDPVVVVVYRWDWASVMTCGSPSYRLLCNGTEPKSSPTRQPSPWQRELHTGRWEEEDGDRKPEGRWKKNRRQRLYDLFPGVAPSTGHRDSVLRPGGSAGGPAPRQALVVRPRPGRGPLGGGGGRLRRGGARDGPGGGGPGKSGEDQEEHAGPGAPQGRCFLQQSESSLRRR